MQSSHTKVLCRDRLKVSRPTESAERPLPTPSDDGFTELAMCKEQTVS